MQRRRFLTGAAGAAAFGADARDTGVLSRDEGYRGIWYYNQPTGDRYVYKYSGGFATYPQQHAPIAIHAPAAAKTFFCYGGTVKGKQELLHMVSYFDHKTGMVPRPAILLNKKTADAHDNPTIAIDGQGHIWIFSSAHGVSRPAYLHRGVKPWSIDRFEKVLDTNFSYTQPWHVPGQGFLFLHTRYRPPASEPKRQGRALFQMTSVDGRRWSEPVELAFAMQGHYQVSWPDGRGRVATAFDIHPDPVGLNQRTNFYYMETRDLGKTWRNARGEAIALPLREADNAALVRDFHSEGLLCYLKDLQFDPAGRPVVVMLTSKGYEPGPANGPRLLLAARWTGEEWRYSTIGESDHNYDHGSLYIEQGGRLWRYLAPTGAGPQAWATGGEVEEWRSTDDGVTWKQARALTQGSEWNHTYVRRPLHAHPDFYAFWADGDAFRESGSRLYFANREGKVFRLPPVMRSDFEKPEAL